MTADRTGRIFLASLWALLALAALEFLMRVAIFPEYTAMFPELYERHPVFVHVNKPNLNVRRFKAGNYDVVIHTNSMGFRGLERNRAAELKGVWVAGGSNTFGGYVGDDQVFAARLAAHGYPAANLASEGHNIAEQARIIRHLGDLGYRPRAVVMAITLFNAIQDYGDDWDALTKPLDVPVEAPKAVHDRPRDRLVAAAEGVRTSVPTSLRDLRSRLAKSSALYGWLKDGIIGIPALRDWTLKLGLRDDLDFRFPGRLGVDVLRPLTKGNRAMTLIDSTAELTAAVGAMVERRFGVPFGVVLLPSHHQIHPASFQRYLKHMGLAGQDLDALRALDALAGALRARGVATLDTLPALRAAKVKRLTFPDDGHLVAAGHAIVAEALARWLDTGMGSGRPIAKAP
ncbi:MAG TPA: hypothetical protein VGA19_06025 [Rhodospirillales bacterium]